MTNKDLKLKIIQQVSRCQDAELLQTVAQLLDQMGEVEPSLPPSLAEPAAAHPDPAQEAELEELRDSIKAIFGE